MHKSKMFACFAFFPNGDVKRWKYVTDLHSFSLFLAKSHPSWRYFNVYEKGSKAFLKRFYPGNPVPKVLGLFVFFALALRSYLPIREPLPINPYENTFNKTTFSQTTFTNGFNNSATIPTLQGEKGGRLC